MFIYPCDTPFLPPSSWGDTIRAEGKGPQITNLRASVSMAAWLTFLNFQGWCPIFHPLTRVPGVFVIKLGPHSFPTTWCMFLRVHDNGAQLDRLLLICRVRVRPRPGPLQAPLGTHHTTPDSSQTPSPLITKGAFVVLVRHVTHITDSPSFIPNCVFVSQRLNDKSEIHTSPEVSADCQRASREARLS